VMSKMATECGAVNLLHKTAPYLKAPHYNIHS
jgi:hypothetical protein